MSTAAPAFKHANNDIDPVYRFPHLPLGKIGFILREGGSVHRLRCFTRLARPGISTVVRLYNSFDSDAELFMCLT